MIEDEAQHYVCHGSPASTSAAKGSIQLADRNPVNRGIVVGPAHWGKGPGKCGTDEYKTVEYSTSRGPCTRPWAADRTVSCDAHGCTCMWVGCSALHGRVTCWPDSTGLHITQYALRSYMAHGSRPGKILMSSSLARRGLQEHEDDMARGLL